MDRLWAFERKQDGKRVEFFSEVRAGRLTYIIRELSESQDSVTTDRDAVEFFRNELIQGGYRPVSFYREGPAGGDQAS